MAHVYEALYKVGGLLTSAGKEIKNREETLALLKVIWLLKRVSTVHCKWHQKGESKEARGNRATNLTAQEVALEPVEPLQVLVALPEPSLQVRPKYNLAKLPGWNEN